MAAIIVDICLVLPCERTLQKCGSPIISNAASGPQNSTANRKSSPDTRALGCARDVKPTLPSHGLIPSLPVSFQRAELLAGW
jgi:hypothetical protein